MGKKPAEACHFWSRELDTKIDVRLGITAEHIDRAHRRVTLSRGAALEYDILVLATGATVRRLQAPGDSLPRVFYLRTIEDSLNIRSAVESQSDSHPWLLVGAGWIGLETAASLRSLGVNVVVIEPQTQIAARALRGDISAYLQAVHEQHGVKFLLGQTIRAFKDDGQVMSAELSTGECLVISGAIVGIGVIPNIDLAKDAGLVVDNGIVVNEFGRTSDPAIYAVGDVASHPNAFVGALVRLKSWANAQNHAAAVANVIAGGSHPFRDIPTGPISMT